MKDGLQDVGFCFYCFFAFPLLHDLIVKRGRRICDVDLRGDMVDAITDIGYHRTDGGAVSSHRD